MFPRKIRDEVVYIAEGKLEAESVKILLESFGIQAYLNQEAAGAVYGLTVGLLGEVEVCVPLDKVEEAKAIIQEMDEGNLEIDNGETDSPPEE
ncbi:MAG TPA: DUF2007 domain-containing protein [Anaerolineaceae bacterium]|nr:DUF2007 domain-containing protein [Anaerolineaceae bacterium]